MSTLHWNRVRKLLALTVAHGVLLGCVGPRLRISEPSPSPSQAPSVFRAGAAELDITPPLGAPLFGYSWDAKRASGVWTRLKARALALEDATGERLALVQVDLGAVSGLLHRSVAERTAATVGISADRLLIAATHSHAAPGGYFGQKFFNFFGSSLTCGQGYDPEILEYLSSQITSAVRQAFDDLGPAEIASTETDVPGVTHNRSLEARAEDAQCVCAQPKTDPPALESASGASPADGKTCGCEVNGPNPVDSTLRLLRVDRLDGRGKSPLAALFVFAIHGTSMPQSNVLYHGDLHGVASRAFAALVKTQYATERPVVAAFMNGAEGDVSPVLGIVPPSGHEPTVASCLDGHREVTLSSRPNDYAEAMAIHLGSRIAERAFSAYRALDGATFDSNPRLQHAYREVRLSGLRTSRGPVCEEAEVGVATMAGAEDSRSGLYGRFGVCEGHRREEPSGCQTYKLPAFGELQKAVLFQGDYRDGSTGSLLHGMADPGTFPRIAPFQAMRIGDAMVLATVPGEPTTEVGRRIRERVDAAVPRQAVSAFRRVTAVVGLANEYLYYLTTEGEFNAQHYEGASTIYGPLEGLAAIEQLEATARDLGSANASSYDKRRDFMPGNGASLIDSEPCVVEESQISKPAIRGSATYGRFVSVGFTGPKSGQNCIGFPKARIICPSGPLVGPDGIAEDDEGFRFKLRRLQGSSWEARWRVPELGARLEGCRMEVRKDSQSSISSEPFEL